MKKIFNQYKPYFLLFLALFCAFPLLSLFQRTMFWDIISMNLPWRYHLSECIRNGELPLWNPWMNYGFPQMGHYETWYPVSWLFAFLFGYNVGTLQYEFLFHLLVAGIGFYKLSSLFTGLERPTRLIGAVSYMLCGVFVAQASHLGYIISGAWMTFVFYYLIIFLRQPDFKNGLYLVFFYFLLVTGGYAGNFIVITYLCIGIAVIFIAGKLSRNKSTLLKPLFIYVPVMSIILLLMYAVVLTASSELQQYITRTTLDYSNTGFGAMTGSTSLTGYVTLLTPAAACSKNAFWGDYFMLNDVYFGTFNFLITLYFLIRGHKSRYYKLAWVFFISSVIFLMISVATLFPVHYWLYRILPLFDRFRFPSLFRIFFVMQLIFVAMFGWQWIRENNKAAKEFGYAIVLLAVCAIVTCFFITDQNISVSGLLFDFSNHILQLNQSGLLMLDIAIVFLLSAGWFLGRNTSRSGLLSRAVVLLILDLGLHTWIRSPRFVSTDKDPALIANAIDAIPEGFPLPDQKTAMSQMHEKLRPIDRLGPNMFMYYKYPLIEGASPYSTVSYRDALRSGSLEKMLHYPLLAVFSKIEHGVVFDTDYLEKETQSIVPLSAGPNQFSFHIDNCAGKQLVFNHNYYPHWNFYENGKLLKTGICEGNFYTFQLSSNHSELSIRFEPDTIIGAFYISAGAFLVVLVLIAGISFKNLRRNSLPQSGDLLKFN